RSWHAGADPRPGASTRRALAPRVILRIAGARFSPATTANPSIRFSTCRRSNPHRRRAGAGTTPGPRTRRARAPSARLRIEPARDPADRRRSVLARYNGNPVDPVLYLPKKQHAQLARRGGSPARREYAPGARAARDPADRRRAVLARYNGKPLDPLLYLPKK